MTASALRTFAAVTLTVMAVLVLSTGNVVSATPYIQLSLSVSPNPAAGGTEVTVKGTATPVGGTFAEVEVTLNAGSSGCSPSGCHADTAHTYFDFAALTSKRSFSATVRPGGPTIFRVAVTGCNPNDCLNVPASVTLKGPTPSASITYSPAGAIKPGSTLHFTVTGLVNVGPVEADVQTKFIAGLTDPTNISTAGHWSPAPYSYIDADLVMNRSASYTFDAKVTAQVGVTIRLDLNVDPVAGSGAPNYVRKVSLLVGPTPTPTPRKTPVATPTRQPRTPAPTTTATPSAAGEPSAAVTSSIEPASLDPVGSAEFPPVAVALTQTASPTMTPPTDLTLTTASSDAAPNTVLDLTATLGIAAGVLVVFVFLRGHPRR